MNVTVRRPVPADVPELARVNVDTWRHAYQGIVPESRLQMSVEQYVQRWTENVEIGRPGVEFLVADVDGSVAGYAIVGDYRMQDDAEPEDPAPLGELYAIYVDPLRQGLGAGKALHDAAMARLASRAFATAALWVLVENESAIRWYRRQGWEPDGATSVYVAAGQPLPEIRLVRSLV